MIILGHLYNKELANSINNPITPFVLQTIVDMPFNISRCSS